MSAGDITDPIVKPADLESAVFATVAYSDVFDMPLALRDVRRFLTGLEASAPEVAEAAAELVAAGSLGRDGDLFFLDGRGAVLAVHRERTARAAAMWPAARRWSRLLGRLPFVRMVAVTGGLACDSVEDHDDIDLFIIVAPGRLWLTRLAIVTVVRLVGVRGPELCPNFIVADDSLTLDVRTHYVARELAQTVPLVGTEVWQRMLDENGWYREHLPNAPAVTPWSADPEGSRARNGRPGVFRRVVERAISGRLFEVLERREMQRKVAKLTRVSSRRPEVGMPDESSFSRSVCKGHMEGNAAGIEVAWRERIDGRGVR